MFFIIFMVIFHTLVAEENPGLGQTGAHPRGIPPVCHRDVPQVRRRVTMVLVWTSSRCRGSGLATRACIAGRVIKFRRVGKYPERVGGQFLGNLSALVEAESHVLMDLVDAASANRIMRVVL